MTDPANGPIEPTERRPLPVIAVGGSSGCVSSLKLLLAQLPEDLPAAVVVAVRGPREDTEDLRGVLGAATRLSVDVAADGSPLSAGRVYLAPADRHVIVGPSSLHLVSGGGVSGGGVWGGGSAAGGSGREDGRRLGIDRLFSSLADSHGSASAGVVLSGASRDGSAGAVAIHEAGGLVLAESAESAAFEEMPRHARRTGCVDAVLDARELGIALREAVRSGGSPDLGAIRHERPPDPLTAPLRDALEDRHRLDLRHYRRSVLGRRLEERMRRLQISTLADYERHCLAHESELDAFFRGLLVGTTRFFDVPATWTALQELLPRLGAGVGSGQTLRCWIPGCATGEEAWTVAMLLAEARREGTLPCDFRIDATDLDARVLEIARDGVYPLSRVHEIPEPFLSRYIEVGDDHLAVSAELRSRLRCFRHDLLTDAPLANVDLVSCRHLLMYLEDASREKALSLIHYALRPGGLLLLGDSEARADPGPFRWRSRRHVILGKEGGLDRSTRAGLDARRPSAANPPTEGSARDAPRRRLQLYDQLLDRFMPPGFLTDRQGELLETFGGTDELVGLSVRRPSLHLCDLLEADRDGPLGEALQRTLETGAPVHLRLPGSTESSEAEEDGGLELSIEPLGEALLVLVDPSTHRRSADQELIDRIGEELERTRRREVELSAELESSTEDLQAANEELTVSNEELRTSNEELHQANVELEALGEERRRSLRLMRQATADLAGLLRSTNVAAIFLGEDFELRMFTTAAAEVFGLVQDDLGRDFTSFAGRFQEVDLHDLLAAARAEGRRHQGEVHDRDGRSFLLDVSPATPDHQDVFTADQVEADGLDGGGDGGFIVTLVSLEQLVEVRARAERLAALVESSDQLIVGLDFEGRIVHWNRGAERMLGLDSEQMLGRTLATVCRADDRESLRRLENAALAGVAGSEDDLRFETHDGTERTLAVHIAPVHVEGRLVGSSCIGRDVSERRRMERALRVSEEHLQDLYENAPDLHASIDPATGHLVECNATLLRELELSREEILGRPASDLCDPDSVGVLAGALRDLEGRATVRDRRMHLRRPGRASLPVSLNMTAGYAADGTLELCRAVWRDVSEMQRTERHLRREVERREEFLAMLSHELRNPLNAVAAALLLLQREDADESMRSRALTSIGRQTAHLRRLLDDLLDVSRMTQNKLRVEPSRVDLREPLRAALEVVRPLAARAGVELAAEMPSEPVPVEGDPDRLQQLAANLLNNGIKFSDPDGGHVRLDLGVDGSEAVLRVRDDGPGVPQNLRDSIFDLFVQSERSQARGGGGLGVGLTLVRAIARLHGGHVAVGGGHDGGAEFRVTLPLQPGVVGTTTPAEVPEMSQRSGLHILVIEDLDDSREALAAVLELEGHEVDVAPDGHEGLRLAAERTPDLVICDIGLPGLDGYEVIRRLRAEDATGDVRAVALTGYGRARDVERAMEAGFDDHLTKPLQPDALSRCISSLFP